MLSWAQREMQEFPAPWFIAGGWALELFAGKGWRSHGDIDIAIFREDRQSLHRALSGWQFAKAIDGQVTDWPHGEPLASAIHEIHATKNEWRLEFLLNERTADHWIFRRNMAITLPLAAFRGKTKDSLPFLPPEVVLLYKAKTPRPLDEADFLHTAPLLSSAAREWLFSALATCNAQHPWLAQLE